MDYWRNPEVMEAEEELERLHDKSLFLPASKGPESVNVSLPIDSSPFPAHRQNLFPMGGLEGIPTASVAQESELPPFSIDLERVWALWKPYPGVPISVFHSDLAKSRFNFGQVQESRPSLFTAGTSKYDDTIKKCWRNFCCKPCNKCCTKSGW